jgi:hypothetical protein
MLVLDEQLLGRNLEAALGRWYRGSVRAIFRLPRFRTKARRMGKVLRVAHRTVSYYTYWERQIREMPL